MKQYCILCSVFLLIFGIGLFSYYSSNHVFSNYWSIPPSSNKSRSPNHQLLEKADEKLFEDYFSIKTFKKYLHYELGLNISTDKIPEEFTSKVNAAFKTSVLKTLSKNEFKDSFHTLDTLPLMLFTNRSPTLIKYFVHELHEKDIMSGIVQVNLGFIPRTSHNLNRKEELQNPHFIDLSNKHSYFKKISQKNLSTIEAISNTDLPKTNSLYQYSGGDISLHISFRNYGPLSRRLESRTNDSLNAKGFIRYRRYFRGTNIKDINKAFEKKHIMLTDLNIKLKDKNTPFFITSDIYKNFNQSNLNPILDKIKISFGTLLSNDIVKSEDGDHKTKDIQTGSFSISGLLTRDKMIFPFEIIIKDLIYDVKIKKFSKKSNIKIKIKDPDSFNKNFGREKSEIEIYIIEKYAKNLIQHMELNRFHPILLETR